MSFFSHVGHRHLIIRCQRPRGGSVRRAPVRNTFFWGAGLGMLWGAMFGSAKVPYPSQRGSKNLFKYRLYCPPSTKYRRCITDEETTGLGFSMSNKAVFVRLFVCLLSCVCARTCVCVCLCVCACVCMRLGWECYQMWIFALSVHLLVHLN